MAKLLYVESSPRKDRSASIGIAREFIRAYQSAHPSDEVETLDLWSIEMPEFDGQTINAKYRILHGQDHTAAEADAWKGVVDLFQTFNHADKYVFSLPMWNFGVPYKLKHFIDVITQPGLAFNFSPEEGYTGLVTGRPAVVIYARGGSYTDDPNTTSLDFQKPYLETLLGFIGFSNIQSVVVEPTLGTPEQTDLAVQRAKDLATTIASEF